MAPTHSRRALVSVTYHHYRQLLSRNHLHHGLLAVNRDPPVGIPEIKNHWR
jgi:hypothetical protein